MNRCLYSGNFKDFINVDLLKVVYAAAKARGYIKEQLEEIRQNKADRRGAFDKKILLKSVTEE